MNETAPLRDIRVLVTRARQQADQLSSRLTEVGAEVIEVPVIRIGPPDSWQPLDAALRHLEEYDWVIFASVNSVESCLARLGYAGKKIEDLQSLRLAAIGPATAEAMSLCGLQPTFCPSQFVGEVLVNEFPGYPTLSGVKILWPRTNVGRQLVVDKLQEAGAQVDVVPSYKTSEPEDKEAVAGLLFQMIRERRIDVITLASAQSARNFASLLELGLKRAAGKQGALLVTLAELLANVRVATIGPETAAATRKVLNKVDIEAEQYTIDGLVQALVQHAGKNPSGLPETAKL